jgi:ADP-ribose pyrophosphatase YjhB (NUDIX family)
MGEGGGGADPRSWPVKHATSYGGVVFRDGDDGPEVALIRPMGAEPKGSQKVVWALPKGMKEEGEDAETAALREVREETGLEAEIVGSLEPITYWFVWAPEQVRYRKTVHFFLMRMTGGDPSPDAFEVAEVRFFPIAVAAKRAKYASEKKVLELARRALAH